MHSGCGEKVKCDANTSCCKHEPGGVCYEFGGSVALMKAIYMPMLTARTNFYFLRGDNFAYPYNTEQFCN